MTLRFQIGDRVLCNFGAQGWKIGRIVALQYREAHWPRQRTAPYQVLLEADHALIYVPQDDDAYCRQATPEDVRIALRADALAVLPQQASEPEHPGDTGGSLRSLCDDPPPAGTATYRGARCHCCEDSPLRWSAVEMYSEHYRCAARNSLLVSRRVVDLGTVQVGERVEHAVLADLPAQGFSQCPTLVRLPPGLRFFDNGALAGTIRFDPHRGPSYRVAFVAVSAAAWDDPAVGLIRLELTLTVEGNVAPADFDTHAFEHRQRQARATARNTIETLGDIWTLWDRGRLDNSATRARMWTELDRLRSLLQQHPMLDGGWWWALLGGYHMNVHKLLDNALFECELYLGHALAFGDPEVRGMAESNLAGCYQKRQLEAARFLWMDGLQQMLRGAWPEAVETLRRAADLKDGWGWAVNYGDIWMAEAAARLVHGADLAGHGEASGEQSRSWVTEAERVLGKALTRSTEAQVFGATGHPWAAELREAVAAYHALQGADPTLWRASLEERTLYWCGQALSGMPPFPPRPRPRRVDAAALAEQLPGHPA